MSKYKRHQQGFSLIELMVGLTIGLVLSFAVVQIYVLQTSAYSTANSQASIQNTENAIIALVTPIIRSTGFAGCGSLLLAVSNLNAGGPNPIATLGSTPTFVKGYNGGTTGVTITANPANDNTASDWTPSLDSTLVGSVEKYSDVLIVLGSAPGTIPLSVTTINSGSSSFTLQGTNGVTISTGQFGAISDCGQAVVFAITGVAGTTISHTIGAGTLQNASSSLPSTFNPGAQFIPLQQSAFFVAHGPGSQSTLMLGILSGSSWTIQPLVSGVEIMKVQYGIGSNGIITQYVTADSVSSWSQVYAIRLGFLIAGQLGSSTLGTTHYTVLDTQVTVPADTRIRHVFELTIHLRNSVT